MYFPTTTMKGAVYPSYQAPWARLLIHAQLEPSPSRGRLPAEDLEDTRHGLLEVGRFGGPS